MSCNGPDTPATDPSQNNISLSTPSIITSLPHDTSRFTQGLEFYDSVLLEGTGQYGQSRLLQVDLKTGRVLQQINLEQKYFGEGITVLRDTIYQLTYKEGTVLLYDAKTFKKIKELPFKGEGWGLTNDGTNLIASNGSSTLYFYQPGSFNLVKEVNVNENGSPVPNINELEYADGYVFANQWQYNYIIKIDPASGSVVAKYDLDGLSRAVNRPDPNDNVLNGIAYNHHTKKFYITGKRWPQLFEIQF